MSQVFYCNFNRVLEKKEEKEDENTIHYYQANRVLINIMTVLEIVYCLVCMMLFLLIIYWNAKQQTGVILGKEEVKVELEKNPPADGNSSVDFERMPESNRFRRRLNQDI